jgi:signal transduction histidine kinase
MLLRQVEPVTLMKPLRPQFRGLIFKLALFYVLLSLPCLVLVESAILIFEYEDLVTGVDAGSLARAAERGAEELALAWPQPTADQTKGLGYWAEAWILRLQRPRGGLVEGESYILAELVGTPLGAAVLDADHHVLARVPAAADWKLEIPPADAADYSAVRARGSVLMLAGSESPQKIRRVLAPVRAQDGSVQGFLFVELRLPVPWHRLLLDLSLEWPIVLGFLIVFGIASSLFLATWVTRRLNRVAHAATAWSNGDFSESIDDRSSDELGRLSALLDRMALELKALMRSRAQLATLAERQRLARDLHDTVKQQAFALNLQLATLRRQLGEHPALERVDQAQRLGQQIQRELVQILEELRASDTELPFAQRLRTRVQQWAQGSGMPLDIDLADAPALPAADQEHLLRITDEALANVLRHSGATRVSLVLRHDATRLMLTITDNGRGYNRNATLTGMGIANMRERALSLPDGQFDLDGDSAQGTRIKVSFSVAARV